ncbi:MAG: AAA family ATPase, partial [Armatimonadetes bacterium]|nr:AAA family ATPase [Armatimonadota bacterium]
AVTYTGYIRVPRDAPAWLLPSNIGDFATREAVNGIPDDEFRALIPATGRVTRTHIEQAQATYMEDHAGDFEYELAQTEFEGPRNIAAGLLGDFFLVPAIRDVADELKFQTTTSFGRLMGDVLVRMMEANAEVEELRKGLDAVFQKLSDPTSETRPAEIQELEEAIKLGLVDWGVDVSIVVVPPDIERLFQLGTDLVLDDGVPTVAQEKGHGLQRAAILALFLAWARVIRARKAAAQEGQTVPRTKSDSLYYAIEEPELYLHPQAQRRLLRSIAEIAEQTGQQVIMSTHSSFFLDIELYKSICVLHKPDPAQGTLRCQCETDIFEGENKEDIKNRFKLSYWLNPDRNELFFARKVVLVEGPTEKTVLPIVAQRLGIYDEDICIVDCGGKTNIRPYLTVLNAFGMKYLAVHDEDQVGVTEDEDKEEYERQVRLFGENKLIHDTCEALFGGPFMVSPDFEGIAGVSKNQGEKWGKPLAAARHFGDANNAVPAELEQLVREAYN